MAQVIHLKECEIFVFLPDLSEASEATPFGDGASLWAFNYFFFNPGLKKVLYFSCQARSSLVNPTHGMSGTPTRFGRGGGHHGLAISEDDEDCGLSMDDDEVSGAMRGHGELGGTWVREERDSGVHPLGPTAQEDLADEDSMFEGADDDDVMGDDGDAVLDVTYDGEDFE